MRDMRLLRWLRGSALFVAGMFVGTLILQPAATPQERSSGLKLNHFGIYVKDMDESKNFYTKQIGFREVFSFKDGAGNPIDYFQISRDTFLEMTPATADHPPGFSHVGIWADDLGATVTELRSRGVKVEDIRVGGTKAPLTNVFDPNGAKLELLAYPPESLQRKAMDAWK